MKGDWGYGFVDESAPLIYICIQSLVQQKPLFLQLITILNAGPAVAISFTGESLYVTQVQEDQMSH